MSGLLVAALGVLVFAGSLLMPTFENRSISPWTVPGIFPGFVGAVLILLGATLALRRSMPEEAIDRDSPTDKGALVRLLVIALVYVSLIGQVPFLPLTAVFFLGFVVVFELPGLRQAGGGWRRYGGLAIFAIAASLLIPWVFEAAFLVTLP